MTNKERYAQLCATESTISLYDQPWWMDVCAGGGDNWDVLLYEKNGNILGTLPYYVKESHGLRYITVPRRTQHNGVWVKYPPSGKYQKRLALEKEVMTALIEHLEEAAQKKKIVYYQQSFSPSVTNWLPFYWKGYHQTTRYTYLIPAGEGYDQIFSKFDYAVRYDVKRAAPHAIIEDSDDIDALYRMHCMTMGRQGRSSSYSKEFVAAFDRALAEHNCRKILLAKDAEGNLHSAVYIAFDANWVYYLFSGTDPQYRKSNFQTVLLCRAIQFACDTGRGFDFEGSMVPGIEQFFREFGPIQTPFFSIHKIYTKNPLLRAAIEHRLR